MGRQFCTSEHRGSLSKLSSTNFKFCFLTHIQRSSITQVCYLKDFFNFALIPPQYGSAPLSMFLDCLLVLKNGHNLSIGLPSSYHRLQWNSPLSLHLPNFKHDSLNPSYIKTRQIYTSLVTVLQFDNWGEETEKILYPACCKQITSY